jgi:hypothetical protein
MDFHNKPITSTQEPEKNYYSPNINIDNITKNISKLFRRSQCPKEYVDDQFFGSPRGGDFGYRSSERDNRNHKGNVKGWRSGKRDKGQKIADHKIPKTLMRNSFTFKKGSFDDSREARYQRVEGPNLGSGSKTVIFDRECVEKSPKTKKIAGFCHGKKNYSPQRSPARQVLAVMEGFDLGTFQEEMRQNLNTIECNIDNIDQALLKPDFIPPPKVKKRAEHPKPTTNHSPEPNALNISIDKNIYCSWPVARDSYRSANANPQYASSNFLEKAPIMSADSQHLKFQRLLPIQAEKNSTIHWDNSIHYHSARRKSQFSPKNSTNVTKNTIKTLADKNKENIEILRDFIVKNKDRSLEPANSEERKFLKIRKKHKFD